MRYLLTVAAVEDDVTPVATIEGTAPNMWGEMYPSEGDPVGVSTLGGVVMSAEQVAAFAEGLGIVQGMAPSDVLGRFVAMLEAVDRG